MMPSRFTALLLVLSLLLLPSAGPAAAEEAFPPQQALERLFTAETLDPSWFAPEFLAAVPLAQVAAIVEQVEAAVGPYAGVIPVGGIEYEILFEQGVVPAQIVLDAAGRIAGLFFFPPRFEPTAGLTEQLAGFAALPGSVSVLVQSEGDDLLAYRPDEPMAVGSSFKLAVLAALKDAVDAGQRDWEDVVRLDEAHKSLPSGILQEWPAGSPLTLGSLAALMISISDNTATDALIHLVGRGAVAARAPNSQPFWTTREAFALKNPENEAYLQAFRGGAAGEAFFESLQDLPLSGEPYLEPTALDVEWFFSVRELCGLMDEVKELPLMSINPGIADPADWARVAFKGGSEPGALNLTTWLEAEDGASYCVSATWNDTENLDEFTFYGLYERLIRTLAN